MALTCFTAKQCEGKFDTMKHTSSIVTVVLAIGWCTASHAAIITDQASALFTSDQEPAQEIVLDSFDTTLGILTDVTVELFHSGSVTIRADNDDPFNTADVQARMMRTWSLTGPDIIGGGTQTILSSVVTLAMDDGDGNTLAPVPPDGVDFGLLSYADLPAGTHDPADLSLYEAAGPGTVSLNVTPDLMVNDLQWVGDAPDTWQMEVQDPTLEVTARVTYTYVPEPMTVMFLALGSLLLQVRRRI
jgi:hypothetical protein